VRPSYVNAQPSPTTVPTESGSQATQDLESCADQVTTKQERAACCVSRRPGTQPSSKHATTIATGKRVGCRSPVQYPAGPVTTLYAASSGAPRRRNVVGIRPGDRHSPVG
jgi:hypothetical protein